MKWTVALIAATMLVGAFLLSVPLTHGKTDSGNRDRGRPCGLPLPHHRAYGSVHGGSADYANACSRRRGGRRGLELCIGEEASIPASPLRWASPFRLAHRPENAGVLPHGSIELLSASTVHSFGGLLRLLCPLLTLRRDHGPYDPAEISRGRPTAFAARPPDYHADL
jgi:hypothetical protein